MIRITLDLAGPTIVALNQDANRCAVVSKRGSKLQSLARDGIFRHERIGCNLLRWKPDCAASCKTRKHERCAHELQKVSTVQIGERASIRELVFNPPLKLGSVRNLF